MICLTNGCFSLPQNGCTILKTHYKKQKAKTIQCRNYKHFHEQSFNFELNNELLKIDIC